MTITDRLLSAFKNDQLFLGQLAILKSSETYSLCHIDDFTKLQDGETSSLTNHFGITGARDISLYNQQGDYRFTKGQLDLVNGWRIETKSVNELRQIIDHIYPAALGLFHAHENGTIRIQHLREKLNRQTGMYRYARTVSDDGAQELVKNLCGPGNNCVKKILWKLDDVQDLEPSAASQFDGTLTDHKEASIPLLCQEACNFFVSKCRSKAKAEFDLKAELDAKH